MNSSPEKPLRVHGVFQAAVKLRLGAGALGGVRDIAVWTRGVVKDRIDVMARVVCNLD
jgi:hypothetical protein